MFILNIKFKIIGKRQDFHDVRKRQIGIKHEKVFGGDFETAADYLDPFIRDKLTKGDNWAVFAPIVSALASSSCGV